MKRYTPDELKQQLAAVNPIEEPRLHHAIFTERIAALQAERDHRWRAAGLGEPPERWDEAGR